MRIIRAQLHFLAKNDASLRFTLLRTFIGLVYPMILARHGMHNTSLSVDGKPATFGALGTGLNAVVDAYGRSAVSIFIWGVLAILPFVDYAVTRRLRRDHFAHGLVIAMSVTLFHLCLFILELLRHHLGCMTFFMSVTCTIRILQTGMIAADVASFFGFTFMNMCTPKWSWSQDNPYFMALIFHLSCLFVGIVILNMRKRILLRFWNQCHIFIIAQKRIEAKKKCLIDIATMHGIPEQSKYVQEFVQKNTVETESAGAYENSKVFQEMKRSSASSIDIELVKNLLDDNYLVDCEELPLSHRVVEASKIDPKYENLRIKYSVVVGVKVLDYHESTSYRSLFRSANSFWDGSDANGGVPDNSMFNVIDELAAKYGITFIRRFGNKWIGTIGFFDEGENQDNRRLLCSKALQMCCDLEHLASIHQKEVCCAIDAGSVIGGFLRSPCFDIFGTEIRWLLLQLSGVRKKAIYCSSAVTKTVRSKQGASSSGFHFDVQAPMNIRVSSDNSGMGFADGVNSHTAYDSVRSSGLDEDTETLMIMDPIECSLLSPSEVDKFGNMIANEKKLQRSTWKYLAMESKAARTREMKDNNHNFRGEGSTSEDRSHHKAKGALFREIDSTFIESSEFLTGISLTDPILEDYSDEEWNEMHEQLEEKLKAISWEVVFRRSYIHYIFQWTSFEDDYAYNAIASGGEQERRSYFWPNFLESKSKMRDKDEARPTFLYDPLDEWQLPVESPIGVMRFFTRVWYRFATSKNANLLRGLWNYVSLLTEGLLKRGDVARAWRKEKRMKQSIPTYEFVDSNFDDFSSTTHRKKQSFVKTRMPSTSASHDEDPETTPPPTKDKDKEQTGKEKDEMVKWGTSISYAKFYSDTKSPSLRTSGDLMFKVVTILGFIFQQFNSNFQARKKDDPRFGTPYLLAGAWVGMLLAANIFERSFDYRFAIPLTHVCVLFASLKFFVVDHPTLNQSFTSEFWQSYTFSTFGDMENELEFLTLHILCLSLYLRKPWLPLVDLFIYILVQAPRYPNPSTLLARLSSMHCASVILYFLVAMVVTFICEKTVLHTYLVEHKLTPFTLKVDEKYSNTVEYHMNHYWMNNRDTLSTNEYSMTQPTVYRDCIIMVMHIKSSVILTAILDPQLYGQFVSSIMEVVQESATESGISLVSVFSGYVVLAALKSSVDLDDQTTDYTKYIAKPFFFMGSFERRIGAFMAANQFSVDWSIGIGIGTVSVGLVGRGKGNVDVVGDVFDLAYVCSTMEEEGVCVYATRAFHEAAVSYNNLPSNFLARQVTLQVGHIGIELFKFQKASYGMTIDDFHYEGFLDSGGFGSVHLAREKLTSTQYAIKVVEFPKRASIELRRTILAEFKIINELKHTNVIFYKHCIMTTHRLYYVMVCMRGGNLKQVVEKYRPPLGDLLYWYAELVLALEYIHKKMIIHHDVKPANCLIGVDGHLRLTDFGLSKVIMSDNTANVQQSIISSTPFSYKNSENGEGKSAPLISKVLALGGSSGMTVFTVLLAAKKESKTKKELKGLFYVCVEVDSPADATEKLSLFGYTDMIILEISEQETEDDLAVSATTTNDAENGAEEALSPTLSAPDEHKDAAATTTTTPTSNSNSNSNSSATSSDNFYLNILEVAMKVAPILPVLVLNRSQVPNSVLQAHYEKRFPGINSLLVIAAPLCSNQNLEYLESMATAGRQAINEAKSPAGTGGASSSHSVGSGATDPPNLDREGNTSTSIDSSGLRQPSTNSAANQRVQDTTNSTTMRPSRPVGTSSFIAPELIEGQSHGPSVDWWACGVTIYECTTGQKLFGVGARTSSEVFKSILEQRVELSGLTRVCTEQARQVDYPKHLMKHCYGMLSNDASHPMSNIEDLVAGLLCRDQAKRLGTGSPKEIKSHRFYGSINWSTHNATEPNFKPEPLAVFDHPHSARKLVSITRQGKRTKVRAEELFYGETYLPHKHNRKLGEDGNTGLFTLRSSSSSKKSKSLRQTSRTLSAGRLKFSNISDLRQNWLRRWPTVSSSQYYSTTSVGNRRASETSSRMPLIEEIEESVASFGMESGTSGNQTGNSTTDMSLSRTETGSESLSWREGVRQGSEEDEGKPRNSRLPL